MSIWNSAVTLVKWWDILDTFFYQYIMVGQCRDGENWPFSAMSCSPGFFSTCAFETWNLSIILPTYRGYFTQIEEITQSAAPSVEALDKQLKGERNRKGESRPTKHRTLGEEKNSWSSVCPLGKRGEARESPMNNLWLLNNESIKTDFVVTQTESIMEKPLMGVNELQPLESRKPNKVGKVGDPRYCRFHQFLFFL